MSRNIAIPTTTKRALDLPSHTKLVYRDAPDQIDRDALKRKLEESESVFQNKPDEPAKPEGPVQPTESESSESESEYSSSEDEEELMRELARIKQERAEAESKRLAEEAEREKSIREQQAATGNPLLAPGGAAALRRRWDDDTVFRNQASTKKPDTRFTNDVVRSDSHKKFLNKYIQ
jgi:protein CWC15